MDPLIFDDVANSVVKLKMYPYFDIAHFILMSTAVRDDTPQSGSSKFSRKHPFACWFATMLMCFGGAILSNFIMGRPLFTCFDDQRAVLTATAVWYLINYSPFDIVYKISRIFSIRLVICVFKEIQRAKKISLGVEHAYHEFPSSLCTCLLAGLLKGTGSSFMRSFACLVYGSWKPKSIEFLNISFTTKVSLLSALTFYCEQLGMIPLPSKLVFLTVLCVLVYLRLAILVFGLTDPFAPIQNLICTIFFGGVVDALKSAVSRKASDAGQSVGTAAPGTGAIGNPSMAAGAAAQAGGSGALQSVSGKFSNLASTNETAFGQNASFPASDKKRD